MSKMTCRDYGYEPSQVIKAVFSVTHQSTPNESTDTVVIASMLSVLRRYNKIASKVGGTFYNVRSVKLTIEGYTAAWTIG